MTTLHYELSGRDGAPVIVLSNSLGTTLQMWDPQMDALNARFRVLRYDTRGHGRSDVPPAPYSIDELGRDVVALIDSLDIERVHFVGISMGGLTGQWLGVHAANRLDSLVVANTAARIGTSEGWRSRATLVRKQGMREVADGAAARWFTAGFAAEQRATVDNLTRSLRASSPDGYAACCDALADADLRESIERIACPTLVIAGRHDPVTTVDDARFIAARVPGARLAELDASHLSNIEAAAAFNDALLRFLGD
jgi:3-oxoadipate enol-lactonase